ncbi:CLUMA_CG000238, isoform A, partial [Clunio marinus]
MLAKHCLVFLAILIEIHLTLCRQSCTKFFINYSVARTIVSIRRLNERNLESNGFVMKEGDIGYTEPGTTSPKSGKANREAETVTTFETLIRDKTDDDFSSLAEYEECLLWRRSSLTSRPKYRSINGYGNNLKNPYWGSSGVPFGRFTPKTYDDGIHAVRKSVTGRELPSARKLVTDVLLKAEKANPPSRTPNMLINLIVLYLTHDMAFQAPVEGITREKIRCCSKQNKNVLPPDFLNSACLPISVPDDDPFYKAKNVGCLNMIRAQQSTTPYKLQSGEILNKATSFMDHSIIYGAEESDTNKIRTFSNGKLRIPSNKVLPTDKNGNYLDSSLRLVVAPIGAVWPALFAKNHNYLADGLVGVNPQWDDERIFQEARRINIAVFQSGIFTGRIIETVFKKRVEETYNEAFDASTSLEFSASYRLGHFYLQDDMWLVDVNDPQKIEKILHSDALGRIDLFENNFDETVRGVLLQPLNFNQFSDEIVNKFAKNEDGIGLDLLSIDIQRGRDHGHPTFLDARRKCGFNSDFKSFDDLIAIFPQSNVDLLKAIYDDVEDIDLHVGGFLETFSTLDNVLAGETYGCIIGEQYRRTMGGDAYFYTHKTNPYPFTDAQINAIESFSLNHVICKNTNEINVPKTCCKDYFKNYVNARVLESTRNTFERNLQKKGFVMREVDIGYIEPGTSSSNSDKKNRQAEVLTTLATLIREDTDDEFSSLSDYEECYSWKKPELTSHTKYRSISGYGNNLKNPYWGSSGTPFGRFAPKTYDDGIHAVRKSVTGRELPSPRKLVTDVLLKAEKANPPSRTPNMFINLIVLYLTHDMAFQAPVEGIDGEKIRCCSNHNKNVLPADLLHSACLPISVPDDDPFYKAKNVGCLNMIRAQQSTTPYKLQSGEILNKRCSKYLLRIPSNKVLPTDKNGNYLDSSLRLVVAPIGAVWPALFARNHNYLADGLVSVNPQWDDERIFQEARRINIAVFQSGIFTGRIIETVFKKRVEETYNEAFDPSISLEFSASYRLGHFYLQDDMWLVDVNDPQKIEKILHSDALGRIDLFENNFDETVRGVLLQPLNFNQFSDEIINKFAKNEDGIGLDLLSIDIQRGRDHGHPTFLDARRKCGFNSDFKSFDDLIAIFPQSNVDLLKEIYDDVEDIDLYVGGFLETFSTLDDVLAGETFGCIIGEQYRKVMGGDAYFYSHETNPYPFTDAQINAIESFSFSNIICKNTNEESVPRIWFILEDPQNPQIPCDQMPPTIKMLLNKILLTSILTLMKLCFIRSHNCTNFFLNYNVARTLVSIRRLNEKHLKSCGFVMKEGNIGYTEPGTYSIGSGGANREADTLTTLAKLIRDKSDDNFNSIEDYGECYDWKKPEQISCTKYRSISGYGNNLKNPYWGSSGTPFGRFAPKTYDDGIHAVRKSVTGRKLPSPRKLVTDVLLKAEKANPPCRAPNMLTNLIVLYLTHDMAFQAPVEGIDGENIRCCSNHNKNVLPADLLHSACLPISVPDDDPFYKAKNVGCLNMIRAQQSTTPYKLQSGEILNKATSFMDHSIIYGTEESDTNKIRTFSNGKLRIPSNKVLPTDKNGNYLDSSLRLVVAPIGAVWPALFARNHNYLADGLVSVNPQWDDERIFQEARRINIAVFQSGIFTGRIIETVFMKNVNETYNEAFDPSTSLEFSAAYRLGHFYLQDDMWLVDDELNVEKILHSDGLGRIDLFENNFDETIRGVLLQPVNFDQFSKEIYNKFAKNKDGIGLDLLSIDIQRGRDHGLPTFLNARRKCGLCANFKTFDDLNTIFPQHNVDLLKAIYDDVEDIDLYVGGTLETLATFDTVLAGETYGCIIGEQYRRTMG